MANPFPGVNPFIEATADLWVGFHNILVTDCSKLLNPILIPRGYAAFVEKRIDLFDESSFIDERLPDVWVTRVGRIEPSRSAGGIAAVLDVEPTSGKLPEYETIPVAYIEVREISSHRLVTGIELLSPTNKSGAGRRDYIGKRASLLASDVHLVEIDLLLGGRRPEVLVDEPSGDFGAIISRAELRPSCEIYSWSIRRAIPRLPIPLREDDRDAILDLGQAYSNAYDGGPYAVTLAYDQPLPGRLSDADRQWALDRVKGMQV
jgi:hypothetical protein